MGILCAILWGGCVSARKSHSFYTRIASSRRDEAISPLESSQLSHCKKAGVPQCRGRAPERGTMTWITYMPFSGVGVFRHGKTHSFHARITRNVSSCPFAAAPFVTGVHSYRVRATQVVHLNESREIERGAHRRLGKHAETERAKTRWRTIDPDGLRDGVVGTSLQ